MQYLLKSDDLPLSAADIRSDIGLISTAYDSVIEGMIAVECSLHVGTCCKVWAVQRFDLKPLSDFFKACRQLGKVVHIGPGLEPDPSFYRLGGKVHQVKVAADPRAVSRVRRIVANQAFNTLPIYEAIERENRGPADAILSHHQRRRAEQARERIAQQDEADTEWSSANARARAYLDDRAMAAVEGVPALAAE